MIYFVQSGRLGPIKIGRSEDPFRRVVHLQTAHPFPLHLLLMLPGDAREESELHYRFQAYRMNGEWFAPAQELMNFIRAERQAEHERDLAHFREIGLLEWVMGGPAPCPA